MSSFLHSSTHFNSVEKSLINLILDNNMFSLPYNLRTILPDSYHKAKGRTNNEITDVMNTIRNISVLTTNLQYKAHSEDVNTDIENELKHLMLDTKTSIKLNNIDLLKALESINYQIEIEHLTELRSLTKKEEASMLILKELINAIALFIVSKMDEYNNSKGWSL